MIPQGKSIVYITIAGLLAMLGGFVWYASLDNPQLGMAEIRLGQVKVMNVNTVEGRANLEVNFVIKNPSEKTFTVSLIDFELFADDVLLGKGQYSTEDIPLPGRAAFYPGSEITLPAIFQLSRSDSNSAIYDSILENQQIKFRAKGKLTVESAWSLVEKEFDISQ